MNSNNKMSLQAHLIEHGVKLLPQIQKHETKLFTDIVIILMHTSYNYHNDCYCYIYHDNHYYGYDLYLSLENEPCCYQQQMRENIHPTSQQCPGDNQAHRSVGYVCKRRLSYQMCCYGNTNHFPLLVPRCRFSGTSLTGRLSQQLSPYNSHFLISKSAVLSFTIY